MTHAIGTLLQLMLTVFGAAAVPQAGAIGIAALALALAVLTLALALAAPHAILRSAPHPRRAIDTSTLLAQVDPDAAGHPRPRAPGVARAA